MWLNRKATELLTGAERYLQERLDTPEYLEAYEAEMEKYIVKPCDNYEPDSDSPTGWCVHCDCFKFEHKGHEDAERPVAG